MRRALFVALLICLMSRVASAGSNSGASSTPYDTVFSVGITNPTTAPLTLLSADNSDGTAVSLIVNSSVPLTTAGDLLLSLRNNGTQKFSVDKDGNVTAAGTITGGTGAAFLQGGNTFGATAVLGTNDLQSLALKTDNATRLTLSISSLTSTLPFLGAAGTAAAPQYSFSGDSDSGVYSAGANSVGIAAGTVGALLVNTTTVQPTVQVQSSLAGSPSSPNYTSTAASTIGLVTRSDYIGWSRAGGSMAVRYETASQTDQFIVTPGSYTKSAGTAPISQFRLVGGTISGIDTSTFSQGAVHLEGGSRSFTTGNSTNPASVWVPAMTYSTASGSAQTLGSATSIYAVAPTITAPLTTTGRFALRLGSVYSTDPDGRLMTVGPIEASVSGTMTPWASSALLLHLTGGGISSGSTTERPYVDFNLATYGGTQFTAATIATQRTVKIQPPTYTFNAAGTMTNAATVGITGAPRQSTNATLTSTHGLYLEGNAVNAVGTPTNASMLTIANAPTGATNNYSMWVQAGSSRFDGDIFSNNSTFNLLNTAATTTINLGGFATTMSVGASGGTVSLPGDLSLDGQDLTSTGGQIRFGKVTRLAQSIGASPTAPAGSACSVQADEGNEFYIRDTTLGTEAGGKCVCIFDGTSRVWTAGVPAPSTGCP